MPDIRIITAPVTRSELSLIAKERFGDMVKAVVDLEKNLMAIGGELHSDEEQLLLEQGSDQRNLWGINLYPAEIGDGFIEFDSMINLRPSQNNRSRGVEEVAIQKRIRDIVSRLVS